MDRTASRRRCCFCCCCRGGAVHLADMNDCSQRLGFHAAAIFAQARAAGTGRPFDIHLTSKCLLSRSLLSSLLVSPPSVTRPFILRHDFWPERFCCSTYLSLSFFSPPATYPWNEMFIIHYKKERKGIKWSICACGKFFFPPISVNAVLITPPLRFLPTTFLFSLTASEIADRLLAGRNNIKAKQRFALIM